MADAYVLQSPRKVNALYNYETSNAHELTFHEGDVIEVVNTFNAPGWWYGKKDNRYGIFPSNYCEPTTEPRRMRKSYRRASEFIKRMQVELGFIKDKVARKKYSRVDSTSRISVPDENGEEMDALQQQQPEDSSEFDKDDEVVESYQKMITEMKMHVEVMLKQMDEYEDHKLRQNEMLRALTNQLDEALKKEEEMYDMMKEVQKQQEMAEAEHAKSMTKLQKENEMLLNQLMKGGANTLPKKASMLEFKPILLVYVFLGLIVGFFASAFLYHC